MSDKEYWAAYYQKHKERYKQRSREWRATHKKELSDYFKKHYQKNRERILEQHKEYYSNNKQLFRKSAQAWREKNREKEKQLDAARRKKNRQKLRDQSAKWRDEHRAWFNLKSKTYIHERRALLKNSGGSFTTKELEELKKKQKGFCPSCMKRVGNKKLTIDHIIPLTKKGPNTIRNIQLLCKPCNSSKHTKTTNFLEGFNGLE